MDSFTKILILVVVVILGMYYYRQYKNWKTETAKLTWPLNYPECPDYWVNMGGGICQNKFNLGNCPVDPRTQMVDPQGEVNFNEDIYKGDNGKHEKCRWAKKCEATWEGIDKLCA
tara:strand:- start:536 stop:880 length:345 start_codon:yes stop_codon:yes gene_type:complete